jgi:hypothetical protein
LYIYLRINEDVNIRKRKVLKQQTSIMVSVEGLEDCFGGFVFSENKRKLACVLGK